MAHRRDPPLPTCLPPSEVIDEDSISAFFVNNMVWAKRLQFMTGRRLDQSTFVTRRDGRTDLNVTCLPHRAVAAGGRFTSKFPADVVDSKYPSASIVMFDVAVQILGTRQEIDAQLVVEALCYRLNKYFNTTDLGFCRSYVCNMVSAFSLGHRIDLAKAYAHLPGHRTSYHPRHFDGLEICMQNDGKYGIRITCILFKTGSGVITGGSSREHHTAHIKTLVRLMYAFALPREPSKRGREDGKGEGATKPAESTNPIKRRKRVTELYRLPPETLARDPRIPAPRVLPGTDPKAKTRKRDAHGKPSVDFMKTLMDGIYTPGLDPTKPFYTPIPGRVVIPNPDPARKGTVLYYYMARGPKGCDHQGPQDFDYDPKVLACRTCGVKAQPFEHSEAHQFVKDTRTVCMHGGCSLSLRQVGPNTVMPECDRCGMMDADGAVYGRRVNKQKRAWSSNQIRMQALKKAEAESKATPPTSTAPSPSATGAAAAAKPPSTTRERVMHIMKQHAQGTSAPVDRYPRFTLSTADLAQMSTENMCVL